jgi:hypothetical protein
VTSELPPPSSVPFLPQPGKTTTAHSSTAAATGAREYEREKERKRVDTGMDGFLENAGEW